MNPSSGNKSIARNLVLLATALGLLWGALVLLFATPLALTGDVSWRQGIKFGLSFWALWPLLVPAVVWLSFRFPIERKRIVRNVALHLLACVLMVATIRAAFLAFRSADNIFPRLQRLVPPGPPGFRTALDVLVYWSLVGVCQAVTHFRRSQERERRAAELEARLTNAQLQALRMQINPHFLFNTLNSIAALVYVNPRAADEMLGDLSGLLRRSLDSMEEQEIPLGQELAFVGAYLSIEQKRFGERLKLEQNVPDDLMKALVPALILQPLVENAIRHGIEPQRSPGIISIEAKHEGQQLHLVVRDSGRGFPSEDVNGSERLASHGIGLSNTRARLLGLYGRNQSFFFGKCDPQGCRVDIRLPFHSQPMKVLAATNEPVA
jgi:signal transduction histidine kinase